jgi:hypothetical protein
MANELETSDVFGGATKLQELVEELDQLFPDFLPTPLHTIQEIMFRSGQRSVVEYLQDKLKNNV